MVLPAYPRKGKSTAAVGDFGSASTVGNLIVGGLVKLSATDAITAGAGGGQSNAVALTTAINNITTVTTAADSVKLPAAVAGLVVFVTNSAASNPMQVFGSGTDTINAVAYGTGVAQAAGKSAAYYCPADGKWLRILSA